METLTFQRMLEKHGRHPGSIIPLIVLHVGAILALFCFTWEGLRIAFSLFLITGLGVTVGLHRLLTHGSFATYRWVRWLFATIGGLSGQSHIYFWATVHRMHHKYSDREGDPHSPTHGFWWSHFLWLTVRTPAEDMEMLQEHFIPELKRDNVLQQICRLYPFFHLLLLVGLFMGGLAYGGPFMSLSWLLWGFFLRMTLMFHTTWAVNSVSHCWGYRNYETNDESRNNLLVGFMSFGEWHNNHHGCPTAANHGRKWWEFDPGYRLIQLLSLCGLAWNVKYEPAPT